jgi:Kef-type K+ transport system membrane component KefB
VNLEFLPQLPLPASQPLLFGLLLVAGMLGGEAARIARLPRVVGYVVVGLAIAPLAAALGFGPLIAEARFFVDIAVGLVLFDLGRRMDLDWMRRDWTLAATGLVEGVATFGLVFAALAALDFPALEAGLAAAIAMASSPAVLIVAVRDDRAQGQVTERSLSLVALNTLVASIIVTILLATVHLEVRLDLWSAVFHPMYLFAGSILLGGAMATGARLLARAVERTPEMHFTVIAGALVAAIGVAQALKLSLILALLALGMFARNDRRRHDLLDVDLGKASRLFYIVLFVVTGASLPPSALAVAGWAAAAFVGARLAGKVLGVLLAAPLGGLRPRQCLALAAALLPMSSVALLMQHEIVRIFPEFGATLSAVVLSGVLVMELAGPVALQWGLRLAGESLPPPERAGTRSPAGEGSATRA